jgi:hypothetical protein
MYNYAFYAYMFYRGLNASSSVENALGFVSFLKNLYRWVKMKTIKDIDETEMGWVLIFTDNRSLIEY